MPLRDRLPFALVAGIGGLVPVFAQAFGISAAAILADFTQFRQFVGDLWNNANDFLALDFILFLAVWFVVGFGFGLWRAPDYQGLKDRFGSALTVGLAAPAVILGLLNGQSIGDRLESAYPAPPPAAAAGEVGALPASFATSGLVLAAGREDRGAKRLTLQLRVRCEGCPTAMPLARIAYTAIDRAGRPLERDMPAAVRTTRPDFHVAVLRLPAAAVAVDVVIPDDKGGNRLIGRPTRLPRIDVGGGGDVEQEVVLVARTGFFSTTRAFFGRAPNFVIESASLGRRESAAPPLPVAATRPAAPPPG